MSIATEITRLQNAKSALKTAINAKNDAQHQISSETLDDYATFVGDIQTGGGGGEYDITATVDGDFQQLDIIDYNYTPITITPTASATATAGKTYTHLCLNNLTFSEIERYAKAISNASDITSSTTDVYIKDGENYYVLSVGDTICYTLSNNEFMIDQIIGFNHDTLTTSTAYGEATTTGKAGITFQMENCLETRSSMNSTSTNAGGWNASVMRTTTLPAIKLTMPGGLQSVIKMVDKKAANGGSTNYSATITSSDNLFLLAEIEIFGSVTNAQNGANEGTQYKYWNINSNSQNRIKFYNNAGTITATIYWLRSCRSTSTSNICTVSTSGSISANAPTNIYGVCFAYCI